MLFVVCIIVCTMYHVSCVCLYVCCMSSCLHVCYFSLFLVRLHCLPFAHGLCKATNNVGICNKPFIVRYLRHLCQLSLLNYSIKLPTFGVGKHAYSNEHLPIAYRPSQNTGILHTGINRPLKSATCNPVICNLWSMIYDLVISNYFKSHHAPHTSHSRTFSMRFSVLIFVIGQWPRQLNLATWRHLYALRFYQDLRSMCSFDGICKPAYTASMVTLRTRLT